MNTLLEVDNLRVRIPTEHGELFPVDGISLKLDAGEVHGIVGESGCGKSVSALAIGGLARLVGMEVSGSIIFDGGVDLVTAPKAVLRRLLGNDIAIVFQDYANALNPVLRVGPQLVEQIRAHEKVSRRAARSRVIDLLKTVRIPDPAARFDCYPHQLSGGMKQRTLLAAALSCRPRLIVCDEITTALDVTTEAGIIEDLQALLQKTGTALIFITHDLGLLARLANGTRVRIAVMYAGKYAEIGDIEDIFSDPLHPYTLGLLSAIPRIDRPMPRRMVSLDGHPPSLEAPPSGCRFRPRCPHAGSECCQEPPMRPDAKRVPYHVSRCWLPHALWRRRRSEHAINRAEEVN